MKNSSVDLFDDWTHAQKLRDIMLYLYSEVFLDFCLLALNDLE